jgi:nicotinate-nucleotide adenylyltransferase
VGVFGGTFNPIHLGHLLAAETARETLALDGVVFVPAGDPWMRTGEAVAAKDDRWNMTALAVQGNPAFAASRVDLDRPGPTYAVDTLRDMIGAGLFMQASGEHPAPKAPPQFWFILGADALAGLQRWKDPSVLLRLCRIAVVTRPGRDVHAVIKAVAAELPEAPARVDIVPGLEVDISATDIRRRMREGRSIRYRVPEAVERYIMERGLYR